ncbi:MAG: hypothetical protein JW908_06245 [Anaerolineales bacterium]|nr:hypothetical protein [Anaerolineales bacterium]
MKKLLIVLNICAILMLLLGAPGSVNAQTDITLASLMTAKENNAKIPAPNISNEAVLSIPAGAFKPFEDGYDYENHGRYLYHLHSPGGGTANGWYVAAVHLPHGAVVNSMWVYSKVNSATPINPITILQRSDMQGNYNNMANVSNTVSGTDIKTGWTDSIDFATIDNYHYSYFVTWDLPVAGGTYAIANCSVMIFYTPPATQTGVISIPAAAFTPYQDGYDYEEHGRYLIHKAGVGTPNGWYQAPVYLPDSSVVTKMTFYWYDNESFYHGAIARFQSTLLGEEGYYEHAYAESTGGGYGSSVDDTIEYGIINTLQSYWVIVDQLASLTNYKSCGVVIEYTHPIVATGKKIIPVGAFSPYENGYDFENHSRYLKHFHSPGGGTQNGWYVAGVNLPQGVIVTKVTYEYYNTRPSGSGGSIHLQRRYDFWDNYDEMAGIGVGGPPLGYTSYSDDSIDNSKIDNNNYSYWMVIDLPVSGSGDDQQTWACAVIIEYAYNTFLPTILKTVW